MEKQIVYVAGPYSARTAFGIMLNIYRARRVAKKLWERGFIVICPHSNSALMDAAIGNDEFIRRYLHLVDVADMVYMLPGWRKSKGARLEYCRAIEKGKRVVEHENS